MPKKGSNHRRNQHRLIDDNSTDFLLTENDIPRVKGLSRLEVDIRRDEISEVLKYNVLQRKSNDNIQSWKSYPGISNIVDIARRIVE